MRIPVLATGISGLVGSRVQELLSDKFEFIEMSLDKGIDITKYEEVEKIITCSPAKIILHMAAKTDVDGCEDDKIYGEEGQAWIVNVVGTQNIISLAKKTGKKVIYISTDFVFDGTKKFYREEDEPNPVNWYAVTKYEGENIVLNSGIEFNIVRIAYPYRAYFPTKKDFVRRILENIRQGKKIYAVTDHIFTPTFIDDIAAALEMLFQHSEDGIYHVVGSQSLSTLGAVTNITELFKLKAEIIPIKGEDYFKGRAFRPFKLALKNDKITKLGFKMKTFQEGLEIIKNQLKNRI